MIALKRERTSAAIATVFLGAAREKKLIALCLKKIELGEIPSKQFDSEYWKKAKTQLKKESSEKCAYCECKVPQVAHGDVEHYRPKDLYWWLAYNYDNYLFCCQICNQTYKSNNFPLLGTKLAGPKLLATHTETDLLTLMSVHSPQPLLSASDLKKYLATLAKEKPALLNPYFADTELYLKWEADENTREVIATANTKKRNASKFLAAMENFYGINRVELRRLRFQEYRHLKVYRLAIKNNIDAELVTESKAMITEMTADDYPFAAMLRYFNR